jgi:acetaldehyde dehydrogenase/alcohol dehydrogenase
LNTLSLHDALPIYGRISDYLSLGGRTPEEKVEKYIAYFDELKKKLDIPPSIQELGINEKEFLDTLEEMSTMAFDDQCTGGNPRYPLVAEIQQLYKDAYYGTGGTLPKAAKPRAAKK